MPPRPPCEAATLAAASATKTADAAAAVALAAATEGADADAAADAADTAEVLARQRYKDAVARAEERQRRPS